MPRSPPLVVQPFHDAGKCFNTQAVPSCLAIIGVRFAWGTIQNNVGGHGSADYSPWGLDPSRVFHPGGLGEAKTGASRAETGTHKWEQGCGVNKSLNFFTPMESEDGPVFLSITEDTKRRRDSEQPNMPQKLRIRNPCDGCTLRRVKCEETKPCYQCRLRGVQCTSMYLRRKRGPKGGPRHAASARIREFQKRVRDSSPRTQLEDPPSPTGDEDIETDGSSCERDRQFDWSPGFLSGHEIFTAPPSDLPPIPAVVHPHQPIPMYEYRHFIQLFRQQAFQIWPVVNSDELLLRLSQPDPDSETLALAASLCAATIAQLRLPEHTATPPRNGTSSSQFATECLRLRELYDYRETYSTAAVLIPFFLHIYYANTNKLRTAGLFLRESITYVHAMRIGQPEVDQHLGKGERCLRLRIYWLLFISERTYCVQHEIPAILRPIDTPPEFEDGTGDEGLSQAFKTLSQLFVYLEGDFTATSMSTALSEAPVERQKIVCYQTNLSLVPDDAAPHEAQRVDLFVTRQWIRLLLWEYTSRHFAMASSPADQAFSLLLPIKIGHELLSLFSIVTDAAIKTHGYGMELKIFRLADALMDLIACASISARSDAMLATSGEMLCSFRRILTAVGGQDSAFVHKLDSRRAELDFDTGTWPYQTLRVLEEESTNEYDSASC